MKVWIDAQLPPALARWMRAELEVEAQHLAELGLLGAKDQRIFALAREACAIMVTKDADFLVLLDRLGPPPQVLWITLGNVRNAELVDVLRKHRPRARSHFEAGERLVELGRFP